jgi:MerR family transcriptional regulator/heat shock protein HspR
VSRDTVGVYVMQVASKLTGMHPQTLRKYERAGFLTPARSGVSRRYSDEDIERLSCIKRLVCETGLNLAGVGLSLELRDRLLEVESEFSCSDVDPAVRERWMALIHSMLRRLG